MLTDLGGQVVKTLGVCLTSELTRAVDHIAFVLFHKLALINQQFKLSVK